MKQHSFWILLSMTITLVHCKNFQQTQLEPHAPATPELILGSIPASNPLLLNEGGVIDHFNNDHHHWYKEGDSIKMLTMRGCLVLQMDSATGHEFIYRKFNPLNFSKVSALSVRFKNLSPDNPPIISILLIDEHKNTGLLQHAYPNGDSWIYPLNHYELSKFAAISRISEIRLVPGTLTRPYSGTLYIDEIKGME